VEDVDAGIDEDGTTEAQAADTAVTDSPAADDEITAGTEDKTADKTADDEIDGETDDKIDGERPAKGDKGPEA
jgi:hypothetical protein